MTFKIKPKKLTCRKIAYYEKDEAKASKEYAGYGLKKLSEDEARHHRYFQKLKKEKCKKGVLKVKRKKSHKKGTLGWIDDYYKHDIDKTEHSVPLL